MMLRIVCCFAVIAGCGYIGLMLAAEYDRAISCVRSFMKALKYLEAEILVNNSVLAEAAAGASEISSGAVADVFGDLANVLETDGGDKTLAGAIDRHRGRLHLTAGAEGILNDFSAELGGGDRRREAENIRAAYEKLGLEEEELRQKKAKNSALYKGLGFAGGALIVTLLF